MTNNIEVTRLVDEVDELVSLPDAVQRANQLIESDTATVSDIAEVVSLEPALCSRLLKLVNSSFYGFPSQIDSVSRALTLIGMKELRTLLLTTSCVDVFSRIAPSQIDMHDFWFRSVFIGLAAKYLNPTRGKAEQLFLMGLMLNIGRIALFSKRAIAAAALVEEATRQQSSLYEVERQLLGFSSVDVTAALLKKWQLSETLWKPLEYFHHIEDAGGYSSDVGVLRLACRLADCDEPETKAHSAELLDSIRADESLLQQAGVKADDLDSVMVSVNAENIEVLSIVYPGATSIF